MKLSFFLYLYYFFSIFCYNNHSFASSKNLDVFLRDLKSNNSSLTTNDIEEINQILSYYSYLNEDTKLMSKKNFFYILSKTRDPKIIALERFKSIKSKRTMEIIQSLNPPMKAIVEDLHNYYITKDANLQKSLILYNITKNKKIITDENLFEYIERKPFLYYKKQTYQ